MSKEWREAAWRTLYQLCKQNLIKLTGATLAELDVSRDKARDVLAAALAEARDNALEEVCKLADEFPDLQFVFAVNKIRALKQQSLVQSVSSKERT